MATLESEKPSPFHPGEVAMQASLGVAERMEQFGKRVICDFMPDQHRAFYAQLTYAQQPQAQVAEDHALICCAVPAAPEAGGGDRLILEM
ncbi:MAG: hypothetical protein C0510_00320 [Erythrobacter sp.]|nr:hypothetical protein [Erythrobacter sp.]MBA4163069.1 hypothetical protein [Erythrobacter sp.]